ncbi:lysophospholipase [Streptomyces sp. ME02-8801-2C]|uniref:alpha/beta hydrolase n=1 Tax=Streptomyces sp. ME02-8801-2C TaxID=3028680 RepID=UPI0029B31151|nr:alpha/beta hydrolase [Streptomyces sp. ME02-8801-2C]MDX3451736.1 lysophospholipase [Streptomyces sp. ME02-8801-2C]
MADSREYVLTGTRGTISVREWPRPARSGPGHPTGQPPRYLALISHGYAEHMGRYEELAHVLVTHGATVLGPDHQGHGRSAGERAVIADFEDVVTDLHGVAAQARAARPDVPLVLLGHSTGGLIAARFAQRHGDELAALVLSAPVLGNWDLPERLLALDEIPDRPINPAALSRDPAVGAAYAADPLVWHGPMRRPTLGAFVRTLDTVAKSGDIGALPLLWLHGDDDRLVPLAGSRVGVEELRGTDWTERIFPGARHDVFLETDRAAAYAEVTAFVDRVLAARTDRPN